MAQWLADTGYPLMAEVFKFYRANLRQEALVLRQSRLAAAEGPEAEEDPACERARARFAQASKHHVVLCAFHRQ